MTGSSGITGIQQALKANQQLINIEAGNLIRSQIPGAQAVRGTLKGDVATDTGGFNLAGPGTSLSATAVDFSPGPLARTQFTTDLAINGPGFFVLFNNKNELFFTRRGDFHFDTAGHLVNKDGLWVGSFDPKTGELEKTSIKVNPVTDELGDRILNILEQDGRQDLTEIETALDDPGVTTAQITAKLAELKVAGYINEQNIGPDTFFTSNLGELGDQITFDRTGFVINETRGLKRGNQIALALFENPQGLVPGIYGGEIYQATDVAAPGGLPRLGAPDDPDFGSLQPQTLEQSNSSMIPSTGALSFLQRNFTSTASAMKVFISAWDDLINVFR
ncbi:MAG: flagellar hook basal-body protein [Candidatus Sericytochromatia bacterium]|nr:flagellar hook basal-body protein [Candidatus Sericytochromatia bacterium]